MQNTFHQPVTSPILQTLDDPIFAQQNLSVQVLRTDLLHPVISGNKWMKLQPWLRLARHQNNSAIVTKGGPWSNHVHAASYTSHQEGLAFTAIIKAKDGMMTKTLEDVKNWGGDIVYTQNKLYKNEQHWQQFSNAQNALYIPMGGEGAEGEQGVAEFFNELLLSHYDYVICSIGTGTTLAGIAASNLPFDTLMGADPGIFDKNYEHLLNELQQKYSTKSLQIIADKSLEKFGKWPEFLPKKMNTWLAKWQLPTDIVYTAKMFYQFEQLVATGFFKPNSRILLIHTGGLQGNKSLPVGLLKT